MYNCLLMNNRKILIKGRSKLSGSVTVSGSKNAALPELAAVVLSTDEFIFRGMPDVEDIRVMFNALDTIGAEIEPKSDYIKIKLPLLKSELIPREIVETSRASILILGPLIARNGYAKVSLPGGCPIGERKLNYHLNGLRKMGAEIKIEDEHIIAKTKRLIGIDFRFPGKTVTGTENLLMAASIAEGTTILRNCALEPEIGDLIDLLLNMGAEIEGKNTETLIIKGKSSLNGAEHMVIPDRIEMGTYVIAGCFQGNEIVIENVIPEYIESLIKILEEINVNIVVGKNRIKVSASGSIFPVDVETMPYPGFATDLQAQLTTLLTQANGVSRVKENIFNNRFKHTEELNKLGANIKVNGDISIIKGRTELKGNTIKATDLRASAALILGGLIAKGETIIENSYQLFRGYENMPKKIKQLGGNIKLIEE